ncbi:MAG: CBS domain-containing protein [Thermodesulforhabdaceae bacterium]|jgi:predicted transcriptional regulator
MKAKDLMIPIVDCAKVAEDRSIYDALLMIDAWRARSEFDFKPRVIFVHDSDLKITGYVRLTDVVAALGGSLTSEPSSWHELLEQVQGMIQGLPVKDIMYHFSEKEYISEDMTLEKVFLHMVSGSYTYSVVVSNNTTIGVIRLSDLFNALWKGIKTNVRK